MNLSRLKQTNKQYRLSHGFRQCPDVVIRNKFSDEVMKYLLCLFYCVWSSSFDSAKKHGDETRSTVAGADVLTDSSIQLLVHTVSHAHFFISHRY